MRSQSKSRAACARSTAPPSRSASSLVVQVGGSLANGERERRVGVVKSEFEERRFVSESATFRGLQIMSVSADDIGMSSGPSASTRRSNVGSRTFNITVQPAAGEAWVDAFNGNDGNAGTAAAPFKTLGRAFATVGLNGTVWLLGNTVVTAASEGLSGQQTLTGINVPAGVQIKAVTPDAPTIGVPLAFAAGGHVVDVRFDPSTGGRVLASGGFGADGCAGPARYEHSGARPRRQR